MALVFFDKNKMLEEYIVTYISMSIINHTFVSQAIASEIDFSKRFIVLHYFG